MLATLKRLNEDDGLKIDTSGLRAVYRAHLAFHFSCNSKMSSVACPLCQASNFPTAACLISALIKFIDEPLKCPLCACRLQSAASLREHLVNHSHTQQSGKYVEGLKSRNLPSDAPHPVTQVTNSTIIKSFKCRQCSYEAADIMSLHNHLNAMHPERKFLCNHCLKSFKGSNSCLL